MTDSNNQRGLRLYLDSADTAQWQRLLPLGMFHGVTTNPLLLERAGQPCTLENLKNLAQTASDLHCREIHLQTWGENAAAFVACGVELAKMATPSMEIALKLPATPEGFLAASELAALGHRITITAVYSEGQVLAATGFGAAYAAPYYGRLLDAGHDGRNILLGMDSMLKKTNSTLRLLTASLRTAEQVIDLAREGLDTFTFGPDVADQLLSEDLTERAAADFHRAAGAMGGLTS
jgi:transaldolase